MTARLKGRRRQASTVIESVTQWATEQQDVAGLVLVGSYAAQRASMASDVDLVLLTTDVQRHLRGVDWIKSVDRRAAVIRTQTWGPVTERRVRLCSGLHVELGIAPPSWVALPLDAGTAKVLQGGCRVLYDPDDLLADALGTL